MYRNMTDYFEETVKCCPDKMAVTEGGKSISFQDLCNKSKILAGYVDSLTKGCFNRPIAVLLQKSIETVIADIGIIYSSNIFMNLDIKTPAERLSSIVKQAKPVLLITDHKHMDLLDSGEGDLTILNIEEVDFLKDTTMTDQTKERLSRRIDTDPFCIINTSGSTGIPKGVVLNHKSFFDFMDWASETFGLDGSERIGALSPVVFDIYDFELCLMMMKGSGIILLDGSLAVFPARLLEELREKDINFLFWVPTIMVNIANMSLLEKIPQPQLKLIWFAGEVFPTKQFNYWKKQIPKAVFANLYGPIEITLDCIYYIIDREFKDEEPLPIGIPCRNTDILILNEANELCGIGEEGEICVRGTSLAMGYYNNPEKTASAFVQNPLNHAYPERIYRTGDIAYQDEAGEIFFKGRKDSLIKHMGYRIELGEIEHVAVNSLKLVKNCCVVYHADQKEIVLFYESDREQNEVEIKKALLRVLPRYMVPSVFRKMDELPRNANGKIDRLLLQNRVNQ